MFGAFSNFVQNASRAKGKAAEKVVKVLVNTLHQCEPRFITNIIIRNFMQIGVCSVW